MAIQETSPSLRDFEAPDLCVRIKEIYMSLGPIEIAIMASTWGFIAIGHFAAFLIMQKDRQKLPKQLFLMYGIPVCFTIGSVLTPPDPLSSIVIAVPCLILFAAICGCSLLLINHSARKRCEHRVA